MISSSFFNKSAACLTLAFGAAAANQVQLEAAKKNIVFIELDDLIYRFMNKCGRGFTQTPNIDDLASNGVYFSNALTQGAMCGPSRNTLITGLYGHMLGYYHNGHMGAIPTGTWTLGPAMQRAGYTTAWIGKTHVHPITKIGEETLSVSERMIRNMGFDFALALLGHSALEGEVRKSPNPDALSNPYYDYLKSIGQWDNFKNDCITRAPVTSLSDDDYLDGYFSNKAIEWLENNKNSTKPFLLWINFSTPHGPDDVPQPYHDLYPNDLPAPLSSDFGNAVIPTPLQLSKSVTDVASLNAARRGHAASVSYIDTRIGQLIQKLKDINKYDETVIFFFSDQGVMKGNHGKYKKGSLFNEITNPSLIISCPKYYRKNVVEDSPVELIGLIKTVLDIAEASPEDKAAPRSESLLPLLTGNGQYNKKYAFSEVEGARLCIDNRYRFYSTKEGNLLYDMQSDPAELNNIADAHPEIVKRMQDAINKWLIDNRPVLPPYFLKQDKDEEIIRKDIKLHF
jgi:arylsulfatase A-like enzyme